MNSKQFKTVGIGEVLYDVLPSGEKLLGGAPANFGYVSKQLGNQGIIASRVGDDADGKQILESLDKSGIDVSNVQTDKTRPTGTVKVFLSNGQPSYEITENSAWDFLEFSEDWKNLAADCDAVCFGSLAQRSAVSKIAIQDFVKSTKQDCLKIFDVNLRQNYYSQEVLYNSLNLVDVLKLNHEELPVIADIFSIEAEDENALLKNLLEKFGLQIICLTRGENGSLLISNTEISEHSGIKTNVVNTIGAGDAFTASLAHGLLRNWNLGKINELANRVGAFVASKSGAMPDFKEFDFTNFTE